MKVKHLFILGFGIGLQSITNIRAQIPVTPTVGKNSIITFTPVDPVKTIETLKTLNVEKQGATIQYFDGLGRPEQTVSVKSTPDLKDLIQPIEYDEYGRESTKYLPYEAQSGTYGTYRDKTTWQTDQANFYNTLYTDEGPFAKSFTDFEKSPLNRALKQLNPGKDWFENQKLVTFNYGTNLSHEVRCYFVTENNLLQFDGNYLAGKLSMTETIDEDGRKNQEFKDLSGKTILKRGFTAIDKCMCPVETYYVYDDLDRLRYVIPPLAVTGQSNAQVGQTFNADDPNGLLFYYEYDAKGRVIIKKIPGASPIYMVYDQLDRLVLEQDGELRKTSQWIGHTYDSYGREVKSGIVTLGIPNTQAGAQSWFNANVNAIDTKIAAGTLLAQNWYDNYSSLPSTFSGLTYLKLTHLSMPDFASIRTIGQTTATEVKVLNPENGKRTSLKTKTFYDDKGRVLQIVTELYDGGYNRQSYNYDWKGTVLNEEVRVENCPLGNITLERKMSYDHSGRVTAIEQRINGGGWSKIVKNEYNSLGQNIAKILGIDANSFVQEVNNAYNIRGWLTAINNPDNLGSDLFAMRLNYQKQYTLPRANLDPQSNPQYAGNISEIDYAYRDGSPGSVNRMSFRYTYDGLSRLINSLGFSNNGIEWKRDYRKFDTEYSYDVNGNITSLKRFGINENPKGIIDSLNYTYDGNRLAKVTDGSKIDQGYKDINKYNDFSYNANGSMTLDLDKRIKVNYNLLNLPQQVSEIGDTMTVDYIYTATGAKLASLYKKRGLTLSGNRYIGPMVFNYELSSNTWKPDYIPTTEGRLSYGEGSWVQQYCLTDHLGNIRSIFQKRQIPSPITGWAEQLWQQNYYPFGMKLGIGYSGTTNKLGYNGKEEQDFALNGKSLNWLDYGARMYNAELGRWMVIDPLTESSMSQSSYCYVLNNPIQFIDPNGMYASPIYDYLGNFLGTDDQGLQGDPIIMNGYSFEQGMSHNSALSSGYFIDDWINSDCFTNIDAAIKILDHFQTLPNRPDWDGIVTIDEGISWAKSHPNLRVAENDVNYLNAKPNDALYLDVSKMDFGRLNKDYFEYVGIEKGVNLLDYVNGNPLSRYTTYALGRTNMTLLSTAMGGMVSVSNGSWNAYDWDYGGSLLRAILIFGERTIKGLDDSHGFPIKVYGTGLLKR